MKSAHLSLFLVFLFILPACHREISIDRLHAEYDWGRPGGRTPMHQMWVVYPEWLAAEDQAETLAMVDSYVTGMQNAHPWCVTGLEWDNYVIMIHNSIEVCVSAPPDPVWCYGWICGEHIVVCWAQVKSMGRVMDLADQDCLPALPHEFMHAILWYQYGVHGHAMYEDQWLQTVLEKAKASSLAISLSDKTVAAALAYHYDPWVIPGLREEFDTPWQWGDDSDEFSAMRQAPGFAFKLERLAA